MMAIKGQKRKHRSKPPAFNDIMIDDVILSTPDLTTQSSEQNPPAASLTYHRSPARLGILILSNRVSDLLHLLTRL